MGMTIIFRYASMGCPAGVSDTGRVSAEVCPLDFILEFHNFSDRLAGVYIMFFIDYTDSGAIVPAVLQP